MITKAQKERQQFIRIYDEFNAWLKGIGFEFAPLDMSCTPADCDYEIYKEVLGGQSMHGVEHYILKPLRLSLRFLRGHDQHKFVIVGYAGLSCSIALDVEQIKKFILNWVRESRDMRLKELEPFMNL